MTLFVGILFRRAFVMRVMGKRLHRLSVEGQKATDELPYVVEENVLAWRMVRLHGAAATQSSRFPQGQRVAAPPFDQGAWRAGR